MCVFINEKTGKEPSVNRSAKKIVQKWTTSTSVILPSRSMNLFLQSFFKINAILKIP